MKKAKRMLRDNKGPGSSLDSDKVFLALLQYFNKFPSQLTTYRQLRDGVPTPRQTLDERLMQMAQHQENIWQWREGPQRRHRNLQPEARVWVKDQTRKTWSKSGTVM